MAGKQNRREAMAALSVAALAGLSARAVPACARADRPSIFAPRAGPRARMLYVNDLSGDPDGLFATVHALLSPSIDLRAIVGTATSNPKESAAISAALANEMVRITGRQGQVPVYPGAATRLISPDMPARSPGIQAIIDEANRTDSGLPLYVAVGGGLTEVASALILEPSIAGKFTLVWIGGTIAATSRDQEYNFGIDPIAAQHVFNRSTVPIWQVPVEAYAACMVSLTELQARVASCGQIGKWLYDQLIATADRFAGFRMNTGEIWTLGDSPLILLTALTAAVPSQFGRAPRYERTGSSTFSEPFAPLLDGHGNPAPRSDGRKIRVYSSVDTRLMFEDFFAKLHMQALR